MRNNNSSQGFTPTMRKLWGLAYLAFFAALLTGCGEEQPQNHFEAQATKIDLDDKERSRETPK